MRSLVAVHLSLWHLLPKFGMNWLLSKRDLTSQNQLFLNYIIYYNAGGKYFRTFFDK